MKRRTKGYLQGAVLGLALLCFLLGCTIPVSRPQDPAPWWTALGEEDDAAVPAVAPALWAAAPRPPGVSAAGAVLVDFTTGQILYDKQARVPRPPASTTKVLTALVVVEHARLDDKVTVSEFAAHTSCSCMHLVPGQQYTVEQLLWGLLMKSGNDAANALAEHVGGSIAGFAVMMNQTAARLGAINSHFANPSGLTARGHVTTPLDLAIITRAALDQPLIARMVATPEVEVSDIPGRNTPLRLVNTNRLLRGFAGADGVKTGTTSAAGKCLIASATREGHRLVAVVLAAGGRWDDAGRLLQWGFDSFDLLRLAAKGDVVLHAQVANGLEPTVPLMATRDVAVLVPAGQRPAGNFRLELTPGALQAPLRAGQVVGALRYEVAGTPRSAHLAAVTPDLATLEAVPRAGLVTRLVRWGEPLWRWSARRGLWGP